MAQAEHESSLTEENSLEQSQATAAMLPAVGKLRLKRLVVQGFKSFAYRSQIVLNEGISAIVGPNGCGKSNIVDAIRWVLGEPNARALRAEGMQDVLFSGAQNHQPSSMAEVTLEFEGSFIDKPLIYDAYEVTRRLFRTGESEYRINQKAARLKDIHQLFADTGVGRHAFAIFEQGKIEQMVSMSHAQRRLILEEAAGISGYKAMKKEALAKWQSIEDQIQRLQSTHSQVLERRQLLQEQANRALEYRRIEQQISQLEQAQLARLWHEANDSLQTIVLDVQATAQQLQTLKQQSSQLQLTLDEKQQQLSIEQAKQEPLQQELLQAKELNLSCQHTQKSLQEQLELEKRNHHQLQLDVSDCQQQQDRLQELVSQAQQQQIQLQELVQKSKKAIEQYSSQEIALRSQLRDARRHSEVLQNKQQELQHQEALTKQKLHSHNKQIEIFQEQITREHAAYSRDQKLQSQLASDIAQLEQLKSELEASLNQINQQVEIERTKLQEALLQKSMAESHYKTLALDVEKAKLHYEWLERASQDQSSLS